MDFKTTHKTEIVIKTFHITILTIIYLPDSCGLRAFWLALILLPIPTHPHPLLCSSRAALSSHSLFPATCLLHLHPRPLSAILLSRIVLPPSPATPTLTPLPPVLTHESRPFSKSDRYIYVIGYTIYMLFCNTYLHPKSITWNFNNTTKYLHSSFVLIPKK